MHTTIIILQRFDPEGPPSGTHCKKTVKHSLMRFSSQCISITVFCSRERLFGSWINGQKRKREKLEMDSIPACILYQIEMSFLLDASTIRTLV